MLMAPMHAGLGRLHGVELVVDGRGRAGQVVDLVDLDVERKADVVAHQLEVRVIEQVRDVAPASGEEIVDAEHVVAFLQQEGAKVRAEETGAAGDEDALAADLSLERLANPLGDHGTEVVLVRDASIVTFVFDHGPCFRIHDARCLNVAISG